MKFHETLIAGVTVIEPHSIGNVRGFFMKIWHELKFKNAGIDVAFVQDNQSQSTQWPLRGMHMQVEPTRESSGLVFDSVADLRRMLVS